MRKSLIILLLVCLPATAKPPAASNEGAAKRWHKIVEQQKYQAYFDKLAFYESSNVWDTINQIGAMGKYQFLASTLSDLGVYITPEQFALNPALFGPKMQDSIIRVFTARNEAQLSEVMQSHPEVSKFAILAAVHLAGVKGVKDYFNFGIDRADGNGTNISKYLQTFEKI